MVNRINPNVARKNVKHEQDSLTGQTASPNPFITGPVIRIDNANDDLIGTLSDAYENKRARQVFEWERAQIRNVYAA